jgi:predicted kinase
MTARPTLHFFCGKAGAGKSTLAARLAHEQDAILLSEDLWLLRLYADQLKTFDDYIRLSRQLKTVVGPLAVQMLQAGQSVVLDFQANTRTGRAWCRSVFEQAGCDHVLHHLPASDEACLARIARRNIERPEGSHHLTEADFALVTSYFQPPDADEGFRVEFHLAGSNETVGRV